MREWDTRNAHYEAGLRAHSAVSRAIKRGDLPPVTSRACVDCGVPSEHYHHHEGYAPEKQLVVVPLCANCHRRRHGKKKGKEVVPRTLTIHSSWVPDPDKPYLITMIVEGERCHRCAHEWVLNDSKNPPKTCPKCRSPYWDRPRRAKKEAKP